VNLDNIFTQDTKMIYESDAICI